MKDYNEFKDFLQEKYDKCLLGKATREQCRIASLESGVRELAKIIFKKKELEEEDNNAKS